MRLWVLSDLHLTYAQAEALHVPGPVPEADACVMAGDLCRSMTLGMRWLSRVVRPRMPVVYVPGNHDFYDTSIAQGMMAARAAAEMAGIVLLQDGEQAMVEGVSFCGGTLWSDFALFAPEAPEERRAAVARNMDASRGRSDYARISACNDGDGAAGRKPLRPEDTAAVHARTVAALDRTLPAPGRHVVVTHHAPHPSSASPDKLDARTPSYVSDLTDSIRRWRPGLWIHGHVHDRLDYLEGDTRIVCNPRGYPHESSGFEWGLTVDV